jgi:hypothetical protein
MTKPEGDLNSAQVLRKQNLMQTANHHQAKLLTSKVHHNLIVLDLRNAVRA